MKAYARDASQDLLHSLERRVRENPLQTVAIAAGLAYPVWRFVANIPAPILLMGAGLALNRVGARTRQGASEDQGGAHLTDTVEGTVQGASSQLPNKLDGAKEKAAVAVGSAAAAVRSSVSELKERASAAINDATASARSTASDALGAARESLSGTYQAGAETAARSADQLSATFTQSKETLVEAMENHPFVVAGIGLLADALIASALPVSEAENRLLGDTSDDLNRARDIASEGVNVAAAAAQSVYQESVSQVQEQGLSSESVRKIVKNAGEKVKEVGQQAAEAMSPASSEPRT
jgi:vacuolar-type H+-ATPase subunit H